MSFSNDNRPPRPVQPKDIEGYLETIERQPPQVLTEALREQFAGELRQLLADFPSIGEKQAGERFQEIIKKAMWASGQEK